MNDDDEVYEFGSYPDAMDVSLANLLMQLMLFRLGGEQKFTQKEILDLQKQIKGVRIKATNDEVLLRIKMR